MHLHFIQKIKKVSACESNNISKNHDNHEYNQREYMSYTTCKIKIGSISKFNVLTSKTYKMETKLNFMTATSRFIQSFMLFSIKINFAEKHSNIQ